MPGLNGASGVAWLRQQPSYLTIPVFILTCNKDPVVADTCLLAGANRVLIKPLRRADWNDIHLFVIAYWSSQTILNSSNNNIPISPVFLEEEDSPQSTIKTAAALFGTSIQHNNPPS